MKRRTFSLSEAGHLLLLGLVNDALGEDPTDLDLGRLQRLLKQARYDGDDDEVLDDEPA